MFHISHESGILEDPESEAPESVYSWTQDPTNGPEKPDLVSIEFKNGVPIKLINLENNITKTQPVDIITYLNELGSKQGIGRLDMVENRFVGIKSRG